MYYARESIRRVREGGGKAGTHERGREEREWRKEAGQV